MILIHVRANVYLIFLKYLKMTLTFYPKFSPIITLKMITLKIIIIIIIIIILLIIILVIIIRL